MWVNTKVVYFDHLLHLFIFFIFSWSLLILVIDVNAFDVEAKYISSRITLLNLEVQVDVIYLNVYLFNDFA